MPTFLKIKKMSSEIFLGQERAVELFLASLLAKGHLLIEDIPGVGKTSLVLMMSKLLGLSFSRLQMTSDLLPLDVLGFSQLEETNQKWVFKKGPIFSQLVLADELNRASSKTQSAFMQALEEGEVSHDGNHYPLPKPFFFVATQNPFEQVGTFLLPEGQLDRFCASMSIGILDKNYERSLLTGYNLKEEIKNLEPLSEPGEIAKSQEMSQKVFVSAVCVDYMLALLQEARGLGEGGRLEGVNLRPLSLRASIHLRDLSKAFAFLASRDHVLMEDIQKAFVPVLRHRITVKASQGETVCRSILARVPVPM